MKQPLKRALTAAMAAAAISAWASAASPEQDALSALAEKESTVSASGILCPEGGELAALPLFLTGVCLAILN